MTSPPRLPEALTALRDRLAGAPLMLATPTRDDAVRAHSAGEGLDAAIDRAKAYIDAGADMIFPEAMRDLGEFETFPEAALGAAHARQAQQYVGVGRLIDRITSAHTERMSTLGLNP